MAGDAWKVISIPYSSKGGQHVGSRRIGMIVTNTRTGISITIPDEAAMRTNHRTKQSAIDAITWYLSDMDRHA